MLFVVERSFALFLLGGVSRFYGLGQANEILIVGPSQTMLGIDKVLLETGTEKHVAKYTREGVNVFDMHQMIVHYFQTCLHKPQLVIYGVDKYLFTRDGLSRNSYTLLYPFMDTPSVDEYILVHASRQDYYLCKYIKLLRFNDLLIGHAIRGYAGVFANFKYGCFDPAPCRQAIADGKAQLRRLEFDSASLHQFYETMAFLQKQGVKVLLLCTPYAEPLNSYEPIKTKSALQLFEKYAADNDSVYFFAAQDMAVHHEWYADINHLNPSGQRVLTERIVKHVRGLDL